MNGVIARTARVRAVAWKALFDGVLPAFGGDAVLGNAVRGLLALVRCRRRWARLRQWVRDCAPPVKRVDVSVSRKCTVTIGIAALVALVNVAACGNSGSNQSGQTTSGASTSASAAEAHNPADVMFAQHMIPHHQQAIQMSDIVLGKQGIDPRVVNLANEIKAAQGPEIQQMQTWLGQWGQPTMPMMPGTEMPGPSTTPSDPHHTDTPSPSATQSHTMVPNQGNMPGMPSMPSQSGMTGMMSEQDMAALQNAQGVEASRLFLTQMIGHHQGAIAMAQNEINNGQYPATVALARSIVSTQQQEIATMQAIVASL